MEEEEGLLVEEEEGVLGTGGMLALGEIWECRFGGIVTVEMILGEAEG